MPVNSMRSLTRFYGRGARDDHAAGAALVCRGFVVDGAEHPEAGVPAPRGWYQPSIHSKIAVAAPARLRHALDHGPDAHQPDGHHSVDQLRSPGLLGARGLLDALGLLDAPGLLTGAARAHPAASSLTTTRLVAWATAQPDLTWQQDLLELRADQARWLQPSDCPVLALFLDQPQATRRELLRVLTGFGRTSPSASQWVVHSPSLRPAPQSGTYRPASPLSHRPSQELKTLVGRGSV